jgi:hypothetical protein
MSWTCKRGLETLAEPVRTIAPKQNEINGKDTQSDSRSNEATAMPRRMVEAIETTVWQRSLSNFVKKILMHILHLPITQNQVVKKNTSC